MLGKQVNGDKNRFKKFVFGINIQKYIAIDIKWWQGNIEWFVNLNKIILCTYIYHRLCDNGTKQIKMWQCFLQWLILLVSGHGTVSLLSSRHLQTVNTGDNMAHSTYTQTHTSQYTGQTDRFVVDRIYRHYHVSFHLAWVWWREWIFQSTRELSLWFSLHKALPETRNSGDACLQNVLLFLCHRPFVSWHAQLIHGVFFKIK